MTSEGSTTASSAYGKEVFMSTFREASKKINCHTIKERGGESLQLVKEKLMSIDWQDVQSQMKDFNLEIIQPYRQTNKVGFKAYLRSTFTLEGPQVENDLDGFNQYNSLCFWWGAFEALLSLLFMNFLAPLVILGGYLAAMALWWIFNRSGSKKWMFVGITLIMFYACWVIIQIFSLLFTIILPLIFAIKLFLTVGMLKYGVALEGKASPASAEAGPYSTLTEGGDNTAGDTPEGDAML